MSKEKLKKDIEKIARSVVLENEELSRHTTFRIGGPAEFIVAPEDEKALSELIIFTRSKKIPVTFLGGGSNVLVRDKGIKGVVVFFKSPYFKEIKVHGRNIKVKAGASLARVCKAAYENSLSGLEPLTGIPGSIAGALIGNAGSGNKTDGASIGEFIESVLVCDKNGNLKLLKKDEVEFGYRKSSLNDYVILEADLKLKKADKEGIKNQMDSHWKKKKETQEMELPSAGCIFKYPHNHGKSSGQLIDECGLKGKKINDAQVSHKHANFIINLGKANACDVLKLMDLIKTKVKKTHGVELEEEIRII